MNQDDCALFLDIDQSIIKLDRACQEMKISIYIFLVDQRFGKRGAKENNNPIRDTHTVILCLLEIAKKKH